MSAWKAKPPYHELYWSDFFTSTMTMSDDAAHAYLFLLGRCWVDGGYLRNDDAFLRLAARMKTQRWNKCKAEVLARFEVAEDGRLFHPRILEDLERVNQKRESQKQKAISRWAKKPNENNDGDDATASIRECPSASTLVDSESNRDSESGSKVSESHPNVGSTDPGGSAAKASGYAFVGKVIRLKAEQFEQWRQSFSAIPDLAAELRTLDDFYEQNLDPGDRKKWFIRCSRALGNSHQKYRKQMKEKEKAKELPIWATG